VKLEDGAHTVAVHFVVGFFVNWKVYFDGVLIHTRKRYFASGETLYRFTHNGHFFVIRTRRWKNISNGLILLLDEKDIDSDELLVDGIVKKKFDVNTASHAGVEPLKQEKPTEMSAMQNFEILHEEDVEEQTVILGSEEFPLDNSHGTDTLSVEYEISKTVSNELSVRTDLEGRGSLNAGFLSILKAEIASRVSRQIGHVVGETVTRRQTLRFSVQPQSSVVYVVIWKRKIRAGNYLISSNGVQRFISYQLNYDLSYEIRTL
jgi:hypothetical protein